VYALMAQFRQFATRVRKVRLRCVASSMQATSQLFQAGRALLRYGSHGNFPAMLFCRS